jgi:hypothetical protein
MPSSQGWFIRVGGCGNQLSEGGEDGSVERCASGGSGLARARYRVLRAFVALTSYRSLGREWLK